MAGLSWDKYALVVSKKKTNGLTYMKKLPKIIKDVGFDFNWSEKKVWSLEVPVEELDISELDWHFEIPFWSTQGGFYDLTPSQVLSDPRKYEIEFIRIENSDLNFPLDIMLWKNKWLLLDGLHRLVKLKKLGMKKIKVRKIPQEAISKIIEPAREITIVAAPEAIFSGKGPRKGIGRYLNLY